MEKKGEKAQNERNIKQEQIHNIVFSKEIGWQEIIHDLINTEQLDPWDIDISVLAKRYLERVEQFEEQNYLISSKVLLAAALLLRIKSEVLLSKYMKSIDEIIFGRKDEPAKKALETFDFGDDIPELFPKSPMPRMRKVTLNELVESLNKAIITENRRIKREFVRKDLMREISIVIPKRRYFISDRINEVYEKISGYFLKNPDEKRIPLSRISGSSRDDRIMTFVSALHLENQGKIWIEQEVYFGEIYLWDRGRYLSEHDPLAELRENAEIEEIINPGK
jgi:segregation and condensation protein A